MPLVELTEEEGKLIFDFIEKNSKSRTISKELKEESLQECDKYLENNNDEKNLKPLTVYYIISKLTENEQINFIKHNIEYIKKYNEEIFLYDMISPKPLMYFLSLNVLKVIKELDKEFIKNIIENNFEIIVKEMILIIVNLYIIYIIIIDLVILI